jgi:hypothetical protein
MLQIGSDDFNRPDGPLGADWRDTSDGGLSIASDQVVGQRGALTSSDVRHAPGETDSGDHYSQIEVTSDSVGRCSGPALRSDRDPTGPRHETFVTKDLVPWVVQHFATTGNEQNWLIGFSKSGTSRRICCSSIRTCSPRRRLDLGGSTARPKRHKMLDRSRDPDGNRSR